MYSSYTYHFDSTNVDSSFYPAGTYLYNSGNLVNYQNPFQFVPKYVGFEFTTNSGFSVSFYQQFCVAGIHNGSRNSNLLCFSPYNSDTGLVSLTNTDTFYISAGNFANITAGSNPFSSISGGFAELDITFYSDFPGSSCPAGPSGSLSITENGTYDVSSYAEAVVDVPPEIIQGDYHDDLVSLNHTILLIPAVAFVIYFFFCIYRMLLRSRS